MHYFTNQYIRMVGKYLFTALALGAISYGIVWCSDVILPFADYPISFDINFFMENAIQHFGAIGNLIDHISDILSLPGISYPYNEISLLEELIFGYISIVCFKLCNSIFKAFKIAFDKNSSFSPFDIMPHLIVVICTVLNTFFVNRVIMHFVKGLDYRYSVILLIGAVIGSVILYGIVCRHIGQKKDLLEIGKSLVYMAIDIICLYTMIYFTDLIIVYGEVLRPAESISIAIVIILCIILTGLSKGVSIFDGLGRKK